MLPHSYKQPSALPVCGNPVLPQESYHHCLAWNQTIDKLPEKKLGEKFFNNHLLEQYNFSVDVTILDNNSSRFLKDIINSAIEHFKRFKDEISKIK